MTIQKPNMPAGAAAASSSEGMKDVKQSSLCGAIKALNSAPQDTIKTNDIALELLNKLELENELRTGIKNNDLTKVQELIQFARPTLQQMINIPVKENGKNTYRTGNLLHYIARRKRDINLDVFKCIIDNWEQDYFFMKDSEGLNIFQLMMRTEEGMAEMKVECVDYLRNKVKQHCFSDDFIAFLSSANLSSNEKNDLIDNFIEKNKNKIESIVIRKKKDLDLLFSPSSTDDSLNKGILFVQKITPYITKVSAGAIAECLPNLHILKQTEHGSLLQFSNTCKNSDLYIALYSQLLKSNDDELMFNSINALDQNGFSILHGVLNNNFIFTADQQEYNSKCYFDVDVKSSNDMTPLEFILKCNVLVEPTSVRQQAQYKLDIINKAMCILKLLEYGATLNNDLHLNMNEFLKSIPRNEMHLNNKINDILIPENYKENLLKRVNKLIETNSHLALKAFLKNHLN